jgi:DHA2 family multidrug resistance protein-like MFS transporter
LVAAGFALVLLFRNDLTVAAVIASLVTLEIGVGISQTVSNDTIVAAVPPAKAGAAAAVSETAYELGAVIGTATLGTVLTASYRSNIELPHGLSEPAAAQAGESIGGATAVANEVPPEMAARLLDSARTAFDSGIAPMAGIAIALTLTAVAVVIRAFRGRPTVGP